MATSYIISFFLSFSCTNFSLLRLGVLFA